MDTSLYVRALRRQDRELLGVHGLRPGAPLWLSAVVLEELYAGARPQDHAILQRLRSDFLHLQRVLVPSLSDWVRAGLVLASLARRYGYERIGRARLTNDALIAIGAARCGFTLLTANRRDFARLAEFCPLRWQLA